MDDARKTRERDIDVVRWCIDRVTIIGQGFISPEEAFDPATVPVADRAREALHRLLSAPSAAPDEEPIPHFWIGGRMVCDRCGLGVVHWQTITACPGYSSGRRFGEDDAPSAAPERGDACGKAGCTDRDPHSHVARPCSACGSTTWAARDRTRCTECLASPAPEARSGDTEKPMDSRVVRHPNGHLMVEHAEAYTPAREATTKWLASVAKAYPYLTQKNGADHIDGEFDNALSDLRRGIEAFHEYVERVRQSSASLPPSAPERISDTGAVTEVEVRRALSLVMPSDAFAGMTEAQVRGSVHAARMRYALAEFRDRRAIPSAPERGAETGLSPPRRFAGRVAPAGAWTVSRSSRGITSASTGRARSATSPTICTSASSA